ncbi:MAG: hypothetical protein LBQ12_15800 [Deltaproteobacteria bacterium]|jgi:hypothetical protein|nr:hypothetical protein [Deltaproteobacteria bacterium]
MISLYPPSGPSAVPLRPAALASAAAVLALALAAVAPSGLRAEGKDERSEEIFRTQPPLTDDDITMLIAFKLLMREPGTANNPQKSAETFDSFIRERPTTSERLVFVVGKIGCGVEIIVKGDMSDEAIEERFHSRLARPNPTELELIRARMDDLAATLMAKP